MMRLGKIIADYRFANNLGVRDVALEIGMPASSLNRFERTGVCDGCTLAKIVLWLFENDGEARRKKALDNR